MLVLVIVFSMLALLAADPGHAADPAPEAMDQAFLALDQGRYLEAIERLEGLAPDDAMARDMLDQIAPFLTGRPPAPRGPTREPDPQIAARLEAATLAPALAEIRERAAGTRIVILNEAHDDPRHRAFALEVARELRGWAMACWRSRRWRTRAIQRPRPYRRRPWRSVAMC